MILKTFTIITIILIAISCGGGGGGGSEATSTSAQRSTELTIPISDAKNLFISKATGGLSKASKNKNAVLDKVFKVTDNGAILEVTYDLGLFLGKRVTDQQSLTPLAMYPASEKYTIFAFGPNLLNVSFSFIVKNETGEAKDLESHGHPFVLTDQYQNVNPVNVNLNGEIVYPYSQKRDTGGGTYIRLRKLSIASDFTITSSVISPDNHVVSRYTMDPLGNILYSGAKLDDSNTHYNKAILTDGSVIDSGITINFFRGPDSSIYYAGQYTTSVGTQQAVFKVEFKSDGTIASGNHGDVNFREGILPSASYPVWSGNKMVMANTLTNVVQEVVNPGKSPIIVSSDYGNINFAIASKDCYWISGSEKGGAAKLEHINFNTNSITKISSASGYTVYSIAGSDKNNIVVCGAKRASDNKNVLIQVTGAGVVTEISGSDTDDEVSNLISIK